MGLFGQPKTPEEKASKAELDGREKRWNERELFLYIDCPAGQHVEPCAPAADDCSEVRRKGDDCCAIGIAARREGAADAGRRARAGRRHGSHGPARTRPAGEGGPRVELLGGLAWPRGPTGCREGHSAQSSPTPLGS